ncbi:MAG: hypothetical protein NTX63_04565 [Candidatus Peregrinibacteria bacterium]|nr:hypothetical protein [Candidatus Peregrinibacteria bacterium]
MPTSPDTNLTPIKESKSKVVNFDINFPAGVESHKIGVDIKRIEELCAISGIRKLRIGTHGQIDKVRKTLPAEILIRSLGVDEDGEDGDLITSLYEDGHFADTMRDIANEMKAWREERERSKSGARNAFDYLLRTIWDGERKDLSEIISAIRIDEQAFYRIMNEKGENGIRSTEEWANQLNILVIRHIQKQGTKHLLAPRIHDTFWQLAQGLLMAGTIKIQGVDNDLYTLTAATIFVLLLNVITSKAKPERLSFTNIAGIEIEEALVLQWKILETRQLIGMIKTEK